MPSFITSEFHIISIRYGNLCGHRHHGCLSIDDAEINVLWPFGLKGLYKFLAVKVGRRLPRVVSLVISLQLEQVLDTTDPSSELHVICVCDDNLCGHRHCSSLCIDNAEINVLWPLGLKGLDEFLAVEVGRRLPSVVPLIVSLPLQQVLNGAVHL